MSCVSAQRFPSSAAAPQVDVFLSYSWAYQQLVQSLHEELTQHGYNCWMDIKQMDGGQCLYEEIQRGLVAARLCIACVSEKYLTSANCQLEFTYAHKLEEAHTLTIIPLLIEKLKLPLKGTVGMLLTPKLYMDFSELNNHNTDWKKHSRFKDLLSQIDKFLHQKQNDGEQVKEHVVEVVAAAGLDKMGALSLEGAAGILYTGEIQVVVASWVSLLGIIYSKL